MLKWVMGLLLAGAAAAQAATSEPITHARIDRDIASYEVNRDLTYTLVETRDATLFTERALRQFDRTARTFYPDKQALEVVEAWVDQPDGSRIQVAGSSIFTRPNAASQSAPGFVNSLTTTVLFPQLKLGSRTHIVWREIQKAPELLGLNIYNANVFSWDTGVDETRIAIPADIPLHWRARGGYTVEDHVSDGVRHITARIEGTRGREVEPAMVSSFDFMPIFIATTLPNQAEIGAIVHRASAGRADVTPEIASLAARIAGDRTGLDAARLLHAWVATNIRYVAVYLSPNDGLVPHAASDVLRAGYGDCKDYVVLLQALLAARGIAAEMALVEWGSRYADLPLWSGFSFNHAILYLPEYDRYLNPTDRGASFDALDRRLAGKQVVRVTPKGVEARLPATSPQANRYRYTARLSLSADGAIEGEASFAMAPNTEIGMRGALIGASSMTDLAQRILTATPEGGFGTIEASDPRDLTRPLSVSARWRSPMAVNPQGRDVFLRVPVGMDMFPVSSQRGKLSPGGARQTPVLADMIDAGWDTTIALPPGLSVARLPGDVDLSTPVGRYTARYRQDGASIVVSRNLVITQQVVPPEGYPDLERLIYAPTVDARAIIALAAVGE